MALYLARRLNARNISLHEGTQSESVGVRRRDGSYGYVRWRGFIDRPVAQALPGARAVKLKIARYAAGDNMGVNWIDLTEEENLLGCLFEGGAYAVIEKGLPVVIKVNR